MSDQLEPFPAVFERATGAAPYPFQVKFATDDRMASVVNIPTGLGKTAAVVLAWLWRRRYAPSEIRKHTPRRLVYCLPMRVLVEQTEKNVRRWIDNLGLADVAVYRLMGGDELVDWEIYPERDAVLVGTQDMLLSRALNRGYAASRARWPIQFGLLNNDCLWVFDEVQLMGSGLATTAQLEAFRRKLAGPEAPRSLPFASVWMSATFSRDWLATVDFNPSFLGEPLELTEDDLAWPGLKDRHTASKPLAQAEARMGDVRTLAGEIVARHRTGTLTLVVLNTVRRATELFDALQKAQVGPKRTKSAWQPLPGNPELVLVHSRFRPPERAGIVQRLLAPLGPQGRIVVSTQVIEAGVDVSATTLFTELAPWASLVQRFGRCNRDGKANGVGGVYWIDLPSEGAAKVVPPYTLLDLEAARQELVKLSDVGIRGLPTLPLKFEPTHVIRARDVMDLFDTTPDLAGNDIDIDRFVRDIEESDVRVFWRDWDLKATSAPPADLPAFRAEELCPAPATEFRGFVKDHSDQVWQWDFREGQWQRPDANAVIPGQVFLVHAQAGGYRPERGWDPKSSDPVDTLKPPKGPTAPPDATDSECFAASGYWQSIAEHTQQLCDEVRALSEKLEVSGEWAEALHLAARWHDRGKAHPVFQAALPGGRPLNSALWAKAPENGWKRYERPHFRHELASALAVLMAGQPLVPDRLKDLVAYLVAAHHGKVRLSIRSLPNEQKPGDSRRFARGIWDNDEIPATDLGGGVEAPAVRISLEPMEIGLCTEPPFVEQPSWADRMIRLRDRLGPFWLAYLEALLRAADMRVSRLLRLPSSNRTETMPST